MVSVFDSRSSGLGPGQGHCFVFLDKILWAHSFGTILAILIPV